MGGPSWICRDAFERARFLDLHGRLLPANIRVFVALIAAVLVTLPSTPRPIILLPTAVGVGFFGLIQRRAGHFERPELWVFAGLLGAQTMIVLGVLLSGTADTPALMLAAWPVLGLAGRFEGRALAAGTGYSMLIVAGAIVIVVPDVLGANALALLLALVALYAVSTIGSVLRRSDIANRAAAILDPLTGMLNRTALLRRTVELEHQSRLTGAPVTVIVADLDRFKAVNDEHGHDVGDAVLREVAHAIRSTLPSYDLAYRLGGEEFAVLLPGTDAPAGAEISERIRAMVAAREVDGLQVTISLGVAASRAGEPFAWAPVYARADAMLYTAKRAGRDRVCVDDGSAADEVPAAIAA